LEESRTGYLRRIGDRIFMPLQLHGNGRIGKNRGQDIYSLKFNETMSTRALCKTMGMSQQNHCKQIKPRTRREIDEELIGQQVKKRRLFGGICGSTFSKFVIIF
jgi:hypothetical protein